MIISLTGFMGCGKSSVGRRLSELLCCPFMDLDDVIVESAGRSIPEIFATDGEPAFRQMELEALKIVAGGGLSKTKSLPSVMSQCAPLAPSHFVGPSPYAGVRKCQFRTSVSSPEDNMLVLALGGGAVMTEECAAIVKEETCCVYLKASIETLIEHLSGKTYDRPMLSGTSPSATVTSSRETTTSSRDAERRDNPLQERITELMSQRSETYENTAHIIIDTDGKCIESIASEIIELLQL